MLHKEGSKIILVSFVITVTIALIAHCCTDIEWFKLSVRLVAFVFLIAILQFFRSPKRPTPKNDVHIIAPVDDKVVVVEEVFEKECFKDKRLQVLIFMSPLNIHVARYVLGGKVIYSKYHPGKYLVVWHPKASEGSERTTVVVGNPVFGGVLYRQVVGALAKCVANYAKVGDATVQGEGAGFIKFGSRVGVYSPLGTKVKVQLGDKVEGDVQMITEK